MSPNSVPSVPVAAGSDATDGSPNTVTPTLVSAADGPIPDRYRQRIPERYSIRHAPDESIEAFAEYYASEAERLRAIAAPTTEVLDALAFNEAAAAQFARELARRREASRDDGDGAA